MSLKKKVFVLLPDGVGLKNFVFSDFFKEIQKEHDVVCWNNTIFPLSDEKDIKVVQIENARNNPISDIYKQAKNIIELKQSAKKYNNKHYLSYIFPRSYKSLKGVVKNLWIDFLIWSKNSEKGLTEIRNKISIEERKTSYYQNCLTQLKEEKPSIVFCANQRHLLAVAPMLAAKDLNIPTATFIFSWDNLPKATLLLETDYYFVWSQYMKEELLKYYNHLSQEQVLITGTPQFEPHFDNEALLSRKEFCDLYNLDISKKYICFSGDDVTTSPYDEYYLQDLLATVKKMNQNGQNIGVIFRKCPVDFSGRYDKIISNYKDIVAVIDPLWTKISEHWNTIMPSKGDSTLLSNTIFHSELVINIGSSMVFDAVSLNKPCAYINYDQPDHLRNPNSNWNIYNIYKFIHFESMPSKEAVFWINSTDEYEGILTKSLEKDYSLDETKKWFDIICTSPQSDCIANFITSINKII